MKRTDIFSFSILAMILTLITLIISIQHYFQENTEPSVFLYLKRHWKNLPIEKLEKVGTDQPCSAGFVPFFSFGWPGTNEACKCGNELFPYECKSTQIQKACLPVLEVAGKNLVNWELQNSPFKLCKKVIPDLDFLSMNSKYSSSCGATEKVCQSESYPVCVPISKDCPISSIHLGSITPSYDYSEQIVVNAQNIFYISRNVSGYTQLVESRVSEGGGVCEDEDLENMSKGRANYIMLKSKRQTCSRVDNRFKRIGQIGENTFFSINNLLVPIENLIGYNVDQSYSYGAYVRNLIPWKNQCRGDMVEDIKNLPSFYARLFDIRKFEVAVASFVFVLYFFWFFIDVFYSKVLSIEELIATQLQIRIERRYIKIFGVLVYGIQQFICLIYHVIIFTKLQNISIEQCSDAVTNSQIDIAYAHFKNWTLGGYILQFLIFIILVTIEMVLFLKIKKIADQNLKEALIRAQLDAEKQKMTPEDEQEYLNNQELYPIREEPEDDRLSAQGPAKQEKEFKLKRNVDKTKAKNPIKKSKNNEINSSVDQNDLVSNIDHMESSQQIDNNNKTTNNKNGLLVNSPPQENNEDKQPTNNKNSRAAANFAANTQNKNNLNKENDKILPNELSIENLVSMDNENQNKTPPNQEKNKGQNQETTKNDLNSKINLKQDEDDDLEDEAQEDKQKEKKPKKKKKVK